MVAFGLGRSGWCGLLTGRTRAVRPANQGAEPRGSRPRLRRCRTRCGGRRASQASRSSSSQAARGSPSRGWPTLPGIDQPLALGQVELLVGARVWPVAGSPSPRENDSATWEWPIRQTRCGWASRHSSACSGDSTYSQIGSRGLAWNRPTCSSRWAGSSLSRYSRVSGADRALGPPRGERGAARELLERERSADAEVVVAGEADRRVPPGQLDARVRLGAVADEIAQAPHLLARRRPRSRPARPRRHAGCRGCRKRLRLSFAWRLGGARLQSRW